MTHLPYPPPWQDIATLAAHLCVCEATIENWVKLGQFPAPRKQGGKRLWRWKDVEAHLASDGVSEALSDQQARDITNATREAAGRNH